MPSLSLHPDVLGAEVIPEDFRSHPSVLAARSALADSHGLLEKFEAKAKELGDDNPTIEELRPQVFERLKKTLDGAYRKVGESLDSIQAQLDSAWQPTEHAAEIRRHIAALPRDERMNFIHARVEEGDAETLGAVWSAPSFLSGIDKGISEGLREQAARKIHPTLVAERDVVRETEMRIRMAGAAVEEDFGPAAELRRKQAREAARHQAVAEEKRQFRREVDRAVEARVASAAELTKKGAQA